MVRASGYGLGVQAQMQPLSDLSSFFGSVGVFYNAK
jgi:hypothetical protein